MVAADTSDWKRQGSDRKTRSGENESRICLISTKFQEYCSIFHVRDVRATTGGAEGVRWEGVGLVSQEMRDWWQDWFWRLVATTLTVVLSKSNSLKEHWKLWGRMSEQ